PTAFAAGLAMVSLALTAPARAQAVDPSPPNLLAQAAASAGSPALAASAPTALSFSLPSVVTGGKQGKEPMYFEADHLEGEAGERTRATGKVRLRQGDLSLQADELTHTQIDNTARAVGKVRIERQGNIFMGPELSLQLDRLEGEFVSPRFWFARPQAGGSAELVEFLGEKRLRATRTTYSSCTPANTAEGLPGEPDWSLQTSSVYMDMEANEGIARNAVIWFKGVPILATPYLSFPLSDERKSGLLPPSFYFDSKSGFEFSLPYYWNIAPDQDATIAPLLSTRRGVGLDLEYRYLRPRDKGVLNLFGLPDDRVAGRSRGMVDFTHQGSLRMGNSPSQTVYDIQLLRVSDDEYWRDFAHALPTKTPRLYDSHLTIERVLNERNWGLGDSQTSLYAGVQSWQTLKDLDPQSDPTLSAIEAPYRRTPQVGIRSRSGVDQLLNWQLQGEFNRFTHPDAQKVSGNRLHAVGQLDRSFDMGPLTLTPRLALHSTSYDLDQPLGSGPRSVTRTIPTFSLDARTELERPLELFGRQLTQTLEPRVRYVRTPYRDQSMLPRFDSAPRDFNQYAIYNDNAFTGVDRISDANEITVGATSRLLDERGAEALRFGVVQKWLLSEQRLNPYDDSKPIKKGLSDTLLLGSTNVIPNWHLDGTTQLGADNQATQQATLGVRYSPGAWRTIGVTYRYNREKSEQIEVGWQWPLSGRKPPLQEVFAQASSPDVPKSGQILGGGGNQCGGAWYSVGRVVYDKRDHRFTNTLAGFEYDAGCWIGRFVMERVAIGQSEATTRLMFQLELIGLSRLALGSNPLRTLQDNIPGYRLLRDEAQRAPALAPQPFLNDDTPLP
ncbi:LPS-assembly protein LptD, partial [Aquabacterium sp.]|uniref:LPS-assembly protein LptD n=1 Tax=Aquabacterium sp. TaxID=1872578 RepID=UPI0027B89794